MVNIFINIIALATYVETGCYTFDIKVEHKHKAI